MYPWSSQTPYITPAMAASDEDSSFQHTARGVRGIQCHPRSLKINRGLDFKTSKQLCVEVAFVPQMPDLQPCDQHRDEDVVVAPAAGRELHRLPGRWQHMRIPDDIPQISSGTEHCEAYQHFRTMNAKRMNDQVHAQYSQRQSVLCFSFSLSSEHYTFYGAPHTGFLTKEAYNNLLDLKTTGTARNTMSLPVSYNNQTPQLKRADETRQTRRWCRHWAGGLPPSLSPSLARSLSVYLCLCLCLSLLSLSPPPDDLSLFVSIG